MLREPSLRDYFNSGGIRTQAIDVSLKDVTAWYGTSR